MTQDEIIKMAKQAGGIPFRDSAIMGWGCEFDIEPLEVFVKLVAAKEREEIARMCDSASEITKDAKTQLRPDEYMAHGVAAGSIHQAERLATAIRARGEA